MSLVQTAAGWEMEWLEAAGIVIILSGAIVATGALVQDLTDVDAAEAYTRYRRRFGRAILVVLIRSMLSLSIEVEINDRWPWRIRGGAR